MWPSKFLLFAYDNRAMHLTPVKFHKILIIQNLTETNEELAKNDLSHRFKLFTT